MIILQRVTTTVPVLVRVNFFRKSGKVLKKIVVDHPFASSMKRDTLNIINAGNNDRNV